MQRKQNLFSLHVVVLIAYTLHFSFQTFVQFNHCPELGTLEWWISGLMLDPLLISRLNNACSPHEFNLQIN